MAAKHRAPKQWALTRRETVTSFENWRQNLVYTLSLDPDFEPYTAEGAGWLKKTKAEVNRGFIDDEDEEDGLTAAAKCARLELMLGQIANYCPVISRNTIVKNSTSLPQIWQSIRLHYGFQSTGANFIDFASIHLEPDETHEDLFQRLTAFAEDHLLVKDGGITHHGSAPAEDEEVSPTLENLLVLTWLKLIDSNLPSLIKQRYGTELRSRTLASIRPEISQAIPSLLDELRSNDARALRTFTDKRRPQTTHRTDRKPSMTKRMKVCPLCTAKHQRSDHWLSECKALPQEDRKFMLRARQISSIVDNDPYASDSETDDEHEQHEQESDRDQPQPQARPIAISQSPSVPVFSGYNTLTLTIDCGATGNMIKEETATRLGLRINPAQQTAYQADGTSKLEVVGETRTKFRRDSLVLKFEGLVVRNLDEEVLAGNPFMEANDISIRPAKKEIAFADGTRYYYKAQSLPSIVVRRTHIVRAPNNDITIFPGSFIEAKVPDDLADSHVAIEPRVDTANPSWPTPALIDTVGNTIRVPNLTDKPLNLRRHEHFGQITAVGEETMNEELPPVKANNSTLQDAPHSAAVSLNPDDILPKPIHTAFKQALLEFDTVFKKPSGGYNGHSGPFKAVVNMGPTQPPQRKGRIPQYARNKLVELQDKFDELEEMGVFVKPENHNITVKYVNPSFLIKKPNGGHRLVTAFADVGRYSKPQPTLLPDVDSTLRQIGQWQYVCVTDLSSAFYQIPLDKASMRYCGVVTPFRGVRAYARCAMGMPGSECALEELMCRVLGDLLREGVVTKLADDLYCGGNTPEDLLMNWKRVLNALKLNNLCLSPAKTRIAPRRTTILGWIWENGTLSANPHSVSTLSSCDRPNTVKEMRSFIGAYKVLARVLPSCASILSPLDTATAGKQSGDRIVWTEDLNTAFSSAQKSLSTCQQIALPQQNDQLWIVTEGAVKSHGIGATMYINRAGKTILAGFFSAKLQKRQTSWLPCEIEALAITVAVRHFSPYVIQSNKTTCILTDSKPCVQAYEKLCRGEFSLIPRVSTFLTAVSRYHVSIKHIAGAANLPSDHASRNALTCPDQSCQVCTFISMTESCVVRRSEIDEILNGDSNMPFLSRKTWISVQSECQDLRRTHAHLSQGTRPSKKLTNVRDVKRYLNVASIAHDGLLVTRRTEPFHSLRECVTVPRHVLEGLLTSIHIQLDHPTPHQLKKVAHRYMFALDMDRAIDEISTNCHQCAALKKAPRTVVEQSCTDPPAGVGVSPSPLLQTF